MRRKGHSINYKGEIPVSSFSFFLPFCTMDSANKIRFWQKKHGDQMLDLIKLSTVNVSGIYLPPSPSDESNSPTQDYFNSSRNSYVPSPDKLQRSSRLLYTPSQQFI